MSNNLNTETITGKINLIAINLLEQNPSGLRTSELKKMIEAKNPNFHPKTVNGQVWKLVENFPDKVYKPERGLFRLLRYK